MKQFLPLFFSVSLFACGGSPSHSEVDVLNGRTPFANSPAYRSTVRLETQSGGLCSASIIAPRLILTAAHCVDETPAVQVHFDRYHKLDVRSFQTSTEIQFFKTGKAEHFPLFDVAIIQLPRDIPESYSPIEVLKDPSQLQNATEIRVAGYGLKADNCQEADCLGTLLEARAEFDSYIDSPYVQSLMVVRGDISRGFGAVCNGDSGGPAFALINDRWYLTGLLNGGDPGLIPSEGARCAAGWDLFTFAGDYLPWIEAKSAQTLMSSPENSAPATEPFLQKGPKQKNHPDTLQGWMNYANHEDSAWFLMQQILKDLAGLEPRSTSVAIRRDGVVTEEQWRSLTHITISDVALQNLAPLKTLPHLRSLTLENEAPVDFESLKSLKQIEFLSFAPAAARQLKSAKALLPMAQSLKRLHIMRPDAELIGSDWSDLATLDQLSLTDVKGAAFGALPPSVSHLNIYRSRLAGAITIPSRVQVLTVEQKGSDPVHLDLTASRSLRDLRLKNIPLEQTSGFSELPDLQILGLQGSIQSFPKLPESLKALDLSGNRLSFLPTLPKQIALLRAFDSGLSDSDCPSGVSCDFDLIRDPQSLEDYCNNAVHAESKGYQMSYLPTLWTTGIPFNIFIGRLQCSSAEAYAQIPTLDARGYELTDLRPLRHLPNLRALNLEGQTAINDYSPLSTLTKLVKLDLSASNFTEPEILKNLSTLLQLRIARSELKELNLDLPELLALEIEGSEGEALKLGQVTLPKLIGLKMRSVDAAPSFDAALPQLSNLDLDAPGFYALPALTQTVGLSLLVESESPLTTPECPSAMGTCTFVSQTKTIQVSGATLGLPGQMPLPVQQSPAFFLPGSYRYSR